MFKYHLNLIFTQKRKYFMTPFSCGLKLHAQLKWNRKKKSATTMRKNLDIQNIHTHILASCRNENWHSKIRSSAYNNVYGFNAIFIHFGWFSRISRGNDKQVMAFCLWGFRVPIKWKQKKIKLKHSFAYSNFHMLSKLLEYAIACMLLWPVHVPN